MTNNNGRLVVAERAGNGNGASAVRREVKGFPGVPVGIPVDGWIVSWEMISSKTTYTALVDALRRAGLDHTVARKMLPQNAFKRAARTLTEGRIIRQVDTDGVMMRFQFTAESSAAGRIDYALETVMLLNLESGEISSDRDDLTADAKAAFDKALVTRTTGDVTSIIHRLFSDKKRASLDPIPINRRGVYFVRKEEGAFVDKIEELVSALGGIITRLPIAAGTPAGDRTVKVAVASRIEGLIEELRGATDAFGLDTSERALVNASERVKLIRHKIVSYQAYLDDEKEKLEASLAGTTAALRAKILEIGREREAAAAATS